MTKAVVYLGHIPHGFYEAEMRSYFSQFGNISRLRLSRNKHTGKSKHYAFIEFENDAVAQVVVETMSNYYLFGSLLKCNIVPVDKVHENMFDGANRKFKVIPWNKIQRTEHNRLKTEEQVTKLAKKLKKKDEIRKAKIKAAGIKYEFEGYSTTD